MSQRAKAASMCTSAGYAKGGMARPAKGPRKPPMRKPPAAVAGPTQMPSDIMAQGAPPMGGPPVDPTMGGAPPMKRGGMAKKGC